MSLTTEQRKVLRAFKQEARRRRASPREKKALVESGIVEANLTNPEGGDRDSVGSLQERGHYGSVRRRMNPTLAARRFLIEAHRANTQGGSAGQLAQRVQRSAFPARYDKVSGRAEQLLKGSDGGPAAPTNAPSAPAADPGAKRALLLGYLQNRGKPDALLNLATGVKSLGNAPDVGRARPQAPQTAARRSGKVVVAPGANRAGAPLSRDVTDFLGRVAGRVGAPVTVGTGTNHSRMTVNGNVSDHWDGHGGDVPARGRKLIRLGQAALVEAGMPESQARKATGGLYNVNGTQVIFNTQEGGDHTDHLHVGRRRRVRRRR